MGSSSPVVKFIEESGNNVTEITELIQRAKAALSPANALASLSFAPHAQRLSWLPGAAAVVFLCSCSILPEKTLEVYELPSFTIASPAPAERLPWTLQVSTPHSNRITDNLRLVTRGQHSRVSAHESAHWSEPPPALIRNRLLDTFRADSRLNTISYDDDSHVPDLELAGNLRAFQVEYIEGAPTAVIKFYATLVQPARNRVIATRGFEVMQPVEGKEIPEVVNAFGKGADTLAANIVDWTVEQSHILQSEAR
jgi:cholesterol transport system auxiliary component